MCGKTIMAEKGSTYLYSKQTWKPLIMTRAILAAPLEVLRARMARNLPDKQPSMEGLWPRIRER
jgi:hypothetical protein